MTELMQQARPRQHRTAAALSGHTGSEPSRSDARIAPDFDMGSAVRGMDHGTQWRMIQGIQQSHGNASIQRMLAASRSQETASAHHESLAGRIDTVRGGGERIEPRSRRMLERSLGVDLTGVRLHTGNESDGLARALDATAFTVGNDIFFRDGSYKPGSESGMQLLAHEVTHTVQQAAGPVDGTRIENGLQVSDPSDRFEQEATNVAQQFVLGEHALTGTLSVQRCNGMPCDDCGDEESSVQPLAAQRDEEELPVDMGDVDEWPESQPPVEAESQNEAPIELEPVEIGPEGEAGPVELEPVEIGPEGEGPVELEPVEIGPEDEAPEPATDEEVLEARAECEAEADTRLERCQKKAAVACAMGGVGVGGLTAAGAGAVKGGLAGTALAGPVGGVVGGLGLGMLSGLAGAAAGLYCGQQTQEKCRALATEAKAECRSKFPT